MSDADGKVSIALDHADLTEGYNRISASEARASFSEILDRVGSTGEPVIVSRHDRPRAAIVPLSMLASARERLLQRAVATGDEVDPNEDFGEEGDVNFEDVPGLSTEELEETRRARQRETLAEDIEDHEIVRRVIEHPQFAAAVRSVVGPATTKSFECTVPEQKRSEYDSRFADMSANIAGASESFWGSSQDNFGVLEALARSQAYGDVVPDFSAESTEGTINFHDWIGNEWCVLISRPEDFPPEFVPMYGSFVSPRRTFEIRNAKLIGISTDVASTHSAWMEAMGVAAGIADYPLIVDANREIAKLLGVADDRDGHIYFIAPDKSLKQFLTYPAGNAPTLTEIMSTIQVQQSEAGSIDDKFEKIQVAMRRIVSSTSEVSEG